MTKKNEVAEQGKFDVAKVTKKIQEFKTMNEDFDTDFIDLGTELKINSRGELESKDNENEAYREIDAIILEGNAKFVLWGAKGTPQEGELQFEVDSWEEAQNRYEALCDENEIFGKSHSLSDIDSRYIITFVNNKGEVFAVNMSKSSKKEFGKYAKKIYKEHGVPVKQVVTKVATQVMKMDKFSWNAMKFDFVSKVGEE